MGINGGATGGLGGTEAIESSSPIYAKSQS